MSSGNCVFHKSEHLTNFCRTPSCWLPLCPECVKIHLQEHMAKGTPPEIDTLANVLEETRENLGELKHVQEELSKRLIDLKANSQGMENEGLHHLEASRNSLISSINEFFEDLKGEYHRRLSEKSRAEGKDLESISRQLSEKSNTIEGFHKKLNSPGFVKYLVMIQTSNLFPSSHEAFREIESRMAAVQRRAPEIRIDEAGLYSIKVDLARHIGIYEREAYGSYPSTPEKMPFMPPPLFHEQRPFPVPPPPPQFIRESAGHREISPPRMVSPLSPLPQRRGPSPPRQMMPPNHQFQQVQRPQEVMSPQRLPPQNHPMQFFGQGQPFPNHFGGERNVYLRENSPPMPQNRMMQGNGMISPPKRSGLSMIGSPNKATSPQNYNKSRLPQGLRLFGTPPQPSAYRSPLKLVGMNGGQSNHNNGNFQNNEQNFPQAQSFYEPNQNFQGQNQNQRKNENGKVDRISLMKKSKNIFGPSANDRNERNE